MTDYTFADLKFKYQELKLSVEAMRREQKTYFAMRTPGALKRSKELEKKVDTLLGI